MDGATRNGHSSLASFLWSFFSFVLSIDVRSRKQLAEDWAEDKDGLLVFSGLFSATIMVFMAGGNHKILCGPIAANALLIAQMSYDLINMLNGTHDDTVAAAQLPSPPSPASYQPGVSTWVNTVWSVSLAFSLACTFFGVFLKRWAFRYLLLLQNSPQIDPRIPRSRPRHHRSQVAEEPDPDTFGPSVIVALMHLFLPLSVFLFYFGLMLFLIGIGVSPSLVVFSSLVIAGVLFSRT